MDYPCLDAAWLRRLCTDLFLQRADLILQSFSRSRASFLRRLNQSGYGINSVAFWSSLFWGFAAFMAFIAMGRLGATR